MKTYLVGGAVRDLLMGRKPHDYDYVVEAESFEAMRIGLLDAGHTIFFETPKYNTIRTRDPSTNRAADYVLARKDGAYSDGRRPDSVEVGTLHEDLARRDFCMNAMAIDGDKVVDPFGGLSDIYASHIRCVGNATERLTEDALRGLRALRFAVTLGFTIDFHIDVALRSRVYTENLSSISTERVREELDKMFGFDTLDSLRMLERYSEIQNYVFSCGIRLQPTMKS